MIVAWDSSVPHGVGSVQRNPRMRFGNRSSGEISGGVPTAVPVCGQSDFGVDGMFEGELAAGTVRAGSDNASGEIVGSKSDPSPAAERLEDLNIDYSYPRYRYGCEAALADCRPQRMPSHCPCRHTASI